MGLLLPLPLSVSFSLDHFDRSTSVLFVDQLTVLLLLLVTGVSSIVHVYSSRYMIGDREDTIGSFAVIALFTFSMILLGHECQPLDVAR